MPDTITNNVVVPSGVVSNPSGSLSTSQSETQTTVVIDVSEASSLAQTQNLINSAVAAAMAANIARDDATYVTPTDLQDAIQQDNINHDQGEYLNTSEFGDISLLPSLP